MVMCIPVKHGGRTMWQLYVGNVYYGLFVSKQDALRRAKPAY